MVHNLSKIKFFKYEFHFFCLVGRHSLKVQLKITDLIEKSIPENAFRELSGTQKLSGGNDVTFLGPEKFVRFEKHQKAFSGALRGPFRAQKVFGSFEKRTPDCKCFIRCQIFRKVIGIAAKRQHSQTNIAFRNTISTISAQPQTCFMGKWHLIQNQPFLREIFKEPPLISFKKGKSLNDMLVRAKI